MPTFEVLGAVFGASVLLAITPGPDNLFVLTQAATRGARAGFLVVLGLCTGLIVHTALVAVGVAAVFATSEFAFRALQSVGAGYLLYLAWGAWRAGAAEVGGAAKLEPSALAMYRRGIIMNVTNPKVSIFFLAFLPQFADAERGAIATQILAFGVVFQISTLLVFGSVALAAGKLGAWLRSRPGVQVGLNRVSAAVFVALALHLLSAEGM